MFQPFRVSFVLCLAIGITLMAAPPLQACMSSNGCSRCGEPCCNQTGNSVTCGCGFTFSVIDGPRTLVRFAGENKVFLTIQGYDTTQLAPFTDCVTAFPPLDTVESVDAVVNYDGRTDQPFDEVSFYRSEGPSATVAEFAVEQGMTTSDKPWYTFQSDITGTVEDGVPNYFVIELTLNEGVDASAFLDELKATGQFLTSGSYEYGTPNHHPFFRQLADGPLTVSMPYAVTPHGPHTPLLPLDQ